MNEPLSAQMTLWSPSERRALRALRAHYRANRDLFDREELGRLAFIRWLYRCGRLESGTPPVGDDCAAAREIGS